jgi:hypothetical protein
MPCAVMHASGPVTRQQQGPCFWRRLPVICEPPAAPHAWDQAQISTQAICQRSNTACTRQGPKDRSHHHLIQCGAHASAISPSSSRTLRTPFQGGHSQWPGIRLCYCRSERADGRYIQHASGLHL